MTAGVPCVCKWCRVHQLVVTSSEGPESTDINWEQAQDESASILNVLRAPTPADNIVRSVPMFLIIRVLTPTI